MPKQTRLANTVAIDMCNAAVDSLDVGGGASTVTIYDGVQPAGGPDEAITTQNELVSFGLDDPAFGGAIDVDPGAQASANGLPKSANAIAAGIASWFRAFDKAGTARIDGSVGLTNSDMLIDDTNIGLGQQVNLNGWDVTQPES